MADFVDIEELRQRIGLESDDAEHDAELEAAAATTLAILETYLDRKLPLAVDEETFFDNDLSVLVRRWPIKPNTVYLNWMDTTGAQPEAKYVDNARGIIFTRMAGAAYPLTIVWEGGFEDLPPDLMWASWAAFDIVWGSSSSWGGSSGAVQSGAAKRISLVGIGSVEFDLGGSTSGAGGSTGVDSAPWGLLPINVTTILDRYRRESVIGVG